MAPLPLPPPAPAVDALGRPDKAALASALDGLTRGFQSTHPDVAVLNSPVSSGLMIEMANPGRASARPALIVPFEMPSPAAGAALRAHLAAVGSAGAIAPLFPHDPAAGCLAPHAYEASLSVRGCGAESLLIMGVECAPAPVPAAPSAFRLSPVAVQVRGSVVVVVCVCACGARAGGRVDAGVWSLGGLGGGRWWGTWAAISRPGRSAATPKRCCSRRLLLCCTPPARARSATTPGR